MTDKELSKLLEDNPDVQVLGEPVSLPSYLSVAPPDHNEFAAKFEQAWRILGGPDLVKEHQFHPTRKWRADYAHLESRVLIELEGGVWNNGRHTRGRGFVNDIEKYNAATMLGWRVLRIPTGGIVPKKLLEFIKFIGG